MAKLYPPNIEGTIPAFTGTTLVVPFSMNRAVSVSEIKTITVKVKKVSTNDLLLDKKAFDFQISSECSATFKIEEEDKWEPKVGQFYRVQIAYVNKNDEIGYFSTTGVIKYTAEPTLKILELTDGAANLHKYNYTAVYEQTEDPTEKLYSMNLKVVDSTGKAVYDSDEIIHSVLNDSIPNQALEKFDVNQDLKTNEVHKIILTAKTVNGIKISSPKYRIIQRDNVNLMFEDIKNIGKMKAEANFDEGKVTISLEPKKDSDDVRLSGTFILSRSEVGSIYDWKKLKKFFLRSDDISKFSYEDYTVEQGKKYVYSLQQYNNYDIYSNRVKSNEVYADFEDMFLLDGERQLKIRFNPKVASMKNNRLENKVNTIGSRYPFITRNGHVNHKEFSLSGLISYQMDDYRNFMSWKDLGIQQNYTDLISENINAEREFKLEVLRWLDDGKPKIFKSPVEGNYIVRLMGISLTPTDTVGRMLHTFNCTASEIAPFDYDTLERYGFISVNEINNIIYKWRTILCSEYNRATGYVEYKEGELLRTGETAYSVRITDMVPGTFLYIGEEKIVIGATGSYIISSGQPITSIRIPEGHKINGSIEIRYRDVYYTQFDKIRGIYLKEIPLRQYIGGVFGEDILYKIRDIKTEILNIAKIRFDKRNIHKIYTPYPFNENNKFYSSATENPNASEDKSISLADLNKTELYEICYNVYGLDSRDENGVIKYSKNGKTFTIDEGIPFYNSATGTYETKKAFYDPATHKFIEKNFDCFNFSINNNTMNIEDIEEYIAKGIKIDSVSIGPGVIAEITMTQQIIEYSYELDHPRVIDSYNTYKTYLDNYMANLGKQNENTLNVLNNYYKKFISVLAFTLAEDYTIGG